MVREGATPSFSTIRGERETIFGDLLKKATCTVGVGGSLLVTFLQGVGCTRTSGPPILSFLAILNSCARLTFAIYVSALRIETQAPDVDAISTGPQPLRQYGRKKTGAYTRTF